MANETQIDLNRFIENQQGKLEFKSETSEEKASRLHKEEADALFKRWRDMIQHLLTMVGAAIIVGFGLFFSPAKPLTQKPKNGLLRR